MSSSASPASAAEPRTKKPVRIGDLLIANGLLTEQQLGHALEHQRASGDRKLLGEILIELKYVSEEQVAESLAQAYGVPFARLSGRMIDPAVGEALPQEFQEKQGVVPMFVVQGKLTLAMSEPTNVFLIEEVERLAGMPVQVVAATTGDIEAAHRSRKNGDNVFVIDEMMEDMAEPEMELVERDVTDLSDLEHAAGDSPVIKLVNYLIFSAVQEGASDIHIEPEDSTLRVRYRVDGRLFEKMRPPFQMTPAVVSRIKIMAGMDISERRVPQDGGITVMLNKAPVDLRVSTMPGKFGEKVVLRIIDSRGANATLEQIGFGYEILQLFRKAIRQPNGVVLVTGPTGSGKSTTLYGALNELNRDDVNICTVEDPVEFNLTGVNQFQVNEKAGFNFAGALRSLLRQDPDIIMLGEIRDGETARIATQAALTGHLVLSTLHTNDAPSAVTRLTNIGVEPFLVAASLRAVLAQRLLRKICKHCKEPAPPPAPTRASLQAIAPGEEPVETIFHGVGCAKCRQTGFSGRVGVFELLAPDDATLEAVGREASLSEIKQIAFDHGRYLTLAQDGLDKVRSGVTTVEELMRAVTIS